MQPPPKLAHRNPRDDAQGHTQSNPESGIVLLMVVFLTFLLLLSLAIAAPNWAKSLQRQKEIETIHRGEQYERAIQIYYRKFHRYPNTIKQLEDTNDERFLRQKYKDPLTGKYDWKLVLYGHAHVHPLGLFGKPLSDLGAVQSSGGMYAVSGNSSSSPSGPSVNNSGSDNMGFGSSSGSGPGSGFGTTSGLGSPLGGRTSGSSPLGSHGGLNSKSSFGSTASASNDSGFQTNAPFVGVVPPIQGHSIVDYRAQDNYDRWEFNYDPVVDELRAKVSILGGSMSSLNGSGNLNGLGNSNKSSGNSNSPFGSLNGSGSSTHSGNGGSSSNSGSSSSSNSGSSDSNPLQ